MALGEIRRIAVSLVLTVTAAQVCADDWPGWRGPARDGSWDEAGLPDSFPAGGLRVRWKAPVGPGLSSPVVAKGRVYLIDSRLARPKAEERVLCLDEATGKPLWTFVHEVAYPDWAFDPPNRMGPRATPVTGGGKLFTLGSLGHLFCFDAATGEVRWKKRLDQDYQVKEFACVPSPLIEGGLLILFAGGKPEACLIALDADTGKEAWKALDEPLTFSSPVVVTAGGKRQLIVWTGASVTSLDPASGRPFWREPLEVSGYIVATPVVHEDLLVLSGTMMRLDPDKPAAKILWPDLKDGPPQVLCQTSTPVLSGDHLYSARSSGELVCLAARTGKQVWQTDKVTEPRNGASIHLTPNGGSVLLFTDQGNLIRARLTPEGYHELARAPLLRPTVPFGGRNVAWAPPAYANGHVFARSDEELVCASLSDRP